MLEIETDIVIVGAGPAGCAAAIRARQDNLRVIMIDSKAAANIEPGETLHPGIEPIFDRLGVGKAVDRAGFHRHYGVWTVLNETRQFVRYGEDQRGPWQGYQVDRKTLHEILQQAAVNAGAALIRNQAAIAVAMAGNRVVGVHTRDRTFRARWTIDASGRTAWLAKRLGIDAAVRSPPLKVRFGWRDGGGEEGDGQPTFAFCERGWNWHAPLNRQRVAWAELRTVDDGNVAAPGMDVTWRFRSGCAGPGFFLVGDAAALLDPASSRGVLHATMSGILCSHLIANCRQPSNKAFHEADAIQVYRQWVSNRFQQDEKALREHYMATPIWPAFEQQSRLSVAPYR